MWDLHYDTSGGLFEDVLWLEIRRHQQYQKLGSMETSILWMSYRGSAFVERGFCVTVVLLGD